PSRSSAKRWRATRPGTFTATAMTRAGYLARLHVTAAKCRQRASHTCPKRPKRPAVYGAGAATASALGIVKLTIKPNAKARAALRRGRTLHVRVSVTFSSSQGGTPTRAVQAVTVHGSK